jgi:hypothetical protein
VLRAAVVAAGAILTCIGIGLIACGVRGPGWQVLVLGVIVLVGTLFERWRYRRIEEKPKGEWQPTGERFIDPSSGDPVEVMFDPRTGERRYVESGEAKDPGP